MSVSPVEMEDGTFMVLIRLLLFDHSVICSSDDGNELTFLQDF